MLKRQPRIVLTQRKAINNSIHTKVSEMNELENLIIFNLFTEKLNSSQVDVVLIPPGHPVSQLPGRVAKSKFY